MRLTAFEIAELIHGVTSKFPRPDGSIVGDWEDTTDIHKLHASDAVREIYTADKKTPEELHDLWMKPLLENGWTRGDYNREEKTHPSLVDFSELDDTEVLKDLIWFYLTEAFRDFYIGY
jgi:hypothetical protein